MCPGDDVALKVLEFRLPKEPLDRDAVEGPAEALIEEARQRARRRRLLLAAVAGVVALVGLSALAVFERTAWSQGSSGQSAKAGVAGGATGSRIAFLSIRTHSGPWRNAAIYVVDANGSGKRVVTRTAFVAQPSVGYRPAWSPDGRKIAFLSVRRQNVDVWTRSGTRGRSGSPDGRKIAFYSERGGNGKIYVMNAGGSDARNVSHSRARGSGLFSWSPQ